MKAENIKLILEEKVCPVHDIHPVVEMNGNDINIACCCAYFSRFCQIEAEYLSSEKNAGLTATRAITSYN
jgi:hypothetical protein